MNKTQLVDSVAMFAFAVHASDKPAAAPQAAAAGKQMTQEECDKAMAECKNEACKETLRKENGCK